MRGYLLERALYPVRRIDECHLEHLGRKQARQHTTSDQQDICEATQIAQISQHIVPFSLVEPFLVISTQKKRKILSVPSFCFGIYSFVVVDASSLLKKLDFDF